MASPFSNTLTIWHALFLREALDRFFGNRVGWAWLIFEPAFLIVLMGFCYSFFRPVGSYGTDIGLWLAVGMIIYFLFRRTAVQTLHAVDCNKAFFAFRQVRPIDAAIVRGSLEFFALFLIAIAIFIPFAFFKQTVIPKDPLGILGAAIGVWLVGLGYGMITAVIQRLIPESGHIIQLLMMPLYFISGVIFPIENIPPQYYKYLFWNPMLHGVEFARYSFFQFYYLPPGLSLHYVYVCAVVLWLIGLALFKLFDSRMLTR